MVHIWKLEQNLLLIISNLNRFVCILHYPMVEVACAIHTLDWWMMDRCTPSNTNTISVAAKWWPHTTYPLRHLFDFYILTLSFRRFSYIEKSVVLGCANTGLFSTSLLYIQHIYVYIIVLCMCVCVCKKRECSLDEN